MRTGRRASSKGSVTRKKSKKDPTVITPDDQFEKNSCDWAKVLEDANRAAAKAKATGRPVVTAVQRPDCFDYYKKMQAEGKPYTVTLDNGAKIHIDPRKGEGPEKIRGLSADILWPPDDMHMPEDKSRVQGDFTRKTQRAIRRDAQYAKDHAGMFGYPDPYKSKADILQMFKAFREAHPELAKLIEKSKNLLAKMQAQGVQVAGVTGRRYPVGHVPQLDPNKPTFFISKELDYKDIEQKIMRNLNIGPKNPYAHPGKIEVRVVKKRKSRGAKTVKVDPKALLFDEVHFMDDPSGNKEALRYAKIANDMREAERDAMNYMTQAEKAAEIMLPHVLDLTQVYPEVEGEYFILEMRADPGGQTEIRLPRKIGPPPEVWLDGEPACIQAAEGENWIKISIAPVCGWNHIKIKWRSEFMNNTEEEEE